MIVDPDKWCEKALRGYARRTSRRSVLERFGLALAGVTALPLLPISRAAAAERRKTPEALTAFARSAQTKDETRCDYWRYCAIDGFLCTCCGGGVHSCPAGTQPSPTAWVGSCINPADGRAYLIAYRDCCGAPACGQCVCADNMDRETQDYRPFTNNDILWCFGTDSMQYHCSTGVVVGMAE